MKIYYQRLLWFYSLMLDYFDKLEGETIHILREVAAQFQRPVILYSVGKDSSVLIHLIRKAFYPGKIPFPLLHIDTGYKFPEMYRFRDEFAQGLGAELIIHQNTMAIAQGANPFDLGVSRCCGLLKTQALLDALNSRSFDAAIGGARRDEEKSRAKERIFSFRDKFGQWDPKMQRPELWSLYNGRVHTGESIRVFPLSNWTEKDIWQYIERENIEIVPLYFAQLRKVIVRGDLLIPITPQFPARSDEKVEEVLCRFRTLGCSPCTGAVRSSASTIREIIEEMDEVSVSERSTRVIDHDREGSMELKKKEGYF